MYTMSHAASLKTVSFGEGEGTKTKKKGVLVRGTSILFFSSTLPSFPVALLTIIVQQWPNSGFLLKALSLVLLARSLTSDRRVWTVDSRIPARCCPPPPRPPPPPPHPLFFRLCGVSHLTWRVAAS